MTRSLLKLTPCCPCSKIQMGSLEGQVRWCCSRQVDVEEDLNSCLHSDVGRLSSITGNRLRWLIFKISKTAINIISIHNRTQINPFRAEEVTFLFDVLYVHIRHVEPTLQHIGNQLGILNDIFVENLSCQSMTIEVINITRSHINVNNDNTVNYI